MDLHGVIKECLKIVNSLKFLFSLFFLRTDIGDSEVCVLSSALKVNSSLTVLNLAFIKHSITLSPFMPASHSISNNIGNTGVSSLSSALEVNSTLTSLDLRMCFVWILFSVLFCFVLLFHLFVILICDEQDWRIRNMFIVRITEGQFISHWIEPGSGIVVVVVVVVLIEIESLIEQTGTILEIQDHHHCQKDWRSIHLSLHWHWFSHSIFGFTLFLSLFLYFFIIVFVNWLNNGISDSGACSLSSALVINSSLTELLLGVCGYYDSIYI